MKRLCFIIVCTLFVSLATGQTWVAKYKNQVRSGMKRYLKENKYTSSTLQEDDASITVLIREPTVQPADFYYHFGENKKCDWLKISSNCDSCLQKEVASVLRNKKAEWQQIAEKKWVSKRSKNLLLEVFNAGGTFYYTIHYTPWTKEEYAALLPRN